MCKKSSNFAAFFEKRSLLHTFWNMILDQILTYNFLMVSAAAHVCMYVCMYVARDELTRGNKSGR